MTNTTLRPGCLPDPPDKRDYRFGFVVSAPSVDWSKEFRLPEPPDTNQGIADCCVGEATSSFHWSLTKIRWAVRSIFAYIALTYGAYLRDGVKQVVDVGQERYADKPDPDPKTPANMRDKTGLNLEAASKNRQHSYYLAGDSIDAIAYAVRNLKGSVFGVFGDSAGWRDLTNPEPPAGGAEWGHALYAFGYHMHDGQKCIIAKSSWCGAQPGHHEHHIKENYFEAGRVFNSWILVPKNHMITRYIVQKGDKLGVLISVDGDGIFNDTIHWAKSEAHFANLKRDYEVPDTAPRIVYPMA